MELVVLNLLRDGQHHGYEMVQILKRNDTLEIREGNIYPILARLQTDGLVTSRSEASQDGPPRRYFAITDLGLKTLDSMNSHFDRMIESIQRVRERPV